MIFQHASRSHFALKLVALAVTVGLAATATAQSNEAQLMNRLDQLAGELEKVKTELKAMKEQQATAAAAAPSAAVYASNAASAAGRGAPATTLTAYGEIGYSRPSKNSSATTTDVGRFVTGFQHRFNERTMSWLSLKWSMR